ncbi:MAG: hypothetical protein IKQ46_17625 [Bacteroidales bacterium]|nr:hypothetical protein [Bacteroidales bacterium]
MENLEEGDITLLRESVENKFGRKILYAKDCMELSASVYDATECKISETTLKRLWNLVNSTFNPSKYTLNSLAKYLSYTDYDEFVFHKDNYKKSTENMLKWNQFQEEAAELSKSTLSSVKNNLGISYEKTIRRTEIINTIFDFIDSDKTAFALIAPSGYGKSTALAQAVDKMLNKDSNYKNIIWYFNCNKNNPLNFLFNQLKDIFSKLLGVNGNQSYKDYFETHPATLNGKIILVLDDVCSNEMLDSINNIIATYKTEKYFKLIISTRTVIWNDITKIVKDINKVSWYNTEWDCKSTVYSNIPILDYKEQIQVLKNCDKFTIRNFEILNKFCMKHSFQAPYFLENLISITKDNLTDIDIFTQYSNQKIYTTKDGFKNQKLIDFILFSTNYGLDTDSTEKKRLSRLIEEYSEQFYNLLNVGVLMEYIVENKLGEKEMMIKFFDYEYFQYQLANYWLKEFGLNENLFIEVASYYSENEKMFYKLFEIFIKYAFHQGNIKLLKSAFDIIDLHIREKSENERMKKVFCTEYQFYPELQDELLQTETESEFYIYRFLDFDNLNGCFLKFLNKYYTKTTDTKHKLTAIMLMCYNAFFEGNEKTVETLYNESQQFDIDVEDEFQYMLTLCIQLIYYYQEDKKIEHKFLCVVEEFSMRYYSKITENRTKYLRINLLLTDILVLTECYEQAKTIFETIFKSELCENDSAICYLLHLEYSFILSKLGYTKKAKNIYSETLGTLEDLPLRHYIYLKMRECELQYYFKKDLSYKEISIAIAKHFNYKYYSKRLENIGSKN